MSVVFITIPGNDRSRFAHELAKRQGVSLELVVVQKPRRKALSKRLKKFSRYNPWKMFVELWYGFLLRLNPQVRNRLKYFTPELTREFVEPYEKTMEVDSVNDDDVYETLREISPDLLVVWGNTILEQRILKTAKRSINLHFGLCPFYRGALANQCAVISDDLDRLGATVHYINGKADAGEILLTVSADRNLPPQELFKDLHSKALEQFLDIVHKLANNEQLPAQSQDIRDSKNFLLKHWTPSVRYKLGRKIINWENEFLKNEGSYNYHIPCK